MKRAFTNYFVLFCVFTLILSDVKAQYLNYQNDSGWFLGLNLGGSYQDRQRAEIDPHLGFAGGFVLGKEWKKPDRHLSFGLQFRYLGGWNRGRSTQFDTVSVYLNEALNGVQNVSTNYAEDSSGVYHNYHTEFNDFSLEGIITLNRLRERTGLILSLFGGIGIQQYQVKMDQLDQFDNKYDYSPNFFLPADPTKSDLRDYTDGEYESYADGGKDFRAGFMPSLGFLLGYQFTPHFSMGLQHRISFTGTNTYDGQKYITNTTALSADNDWMHYTNLTLRFQIGKGQGRTTPVDQNTNNNIDTYTTVTQRPVTLPKPRVEFIDPYSNPHTVTAANFMIRAKIYHVSSANDVTFKQNGVTNLNFTFNPSTNDFTSNVVLMPGENVFEIRGVNPQGSAYSSRIIVYQMPQVQEFPPVVTINNPPYSPYVTNHSQFNVSASIFNVNSPQNVQFQVNGINRTNFTFNPTSKAFSASINLVPGTNTITITGTNGVGSDTKTATIVYQQPAQTLPQPPVVNILNPSLNPTTVSSSSFNLMASVMHVAGPSNITVKVNGNRVYNFSYNPTTDILNLNSTLVQGSNVFEIYAVNDDGSDYASTTVIYNIPNTVLPPVVNITNPLQNPTTVYSATAMVQGQVLNVTGKSQITVKINGVPTSNFTYSTSSKLVAINSALNVGANLFEIAAANSAGTDQASTTIIRQQQNLEQPPVVTYLNPSLNPNTVNSPLYQVQATVLNVNTNNQIAVNVNGSNVSGFLFNPSTKLVTFTASLVQGNNTIKVTGNNSVGTDTETTILVFEPVQVLPPPTVNITAPANNPFNSTASHVNVLAAVTHVSSSNDIDVTVNGMTFHNFVYQQATNQLSLNLGLVQGNNLVQIAATNGSGSASDATNIIYQPIQQCDKPVVTFVQPNVTVLNHINASNVYTVKAKVTQITSTQNVVAKLNGTVVTNVVYNSATQEVTFPVSLANSGNNIEITATNSCGSGTNSATILYGTDDSPCDIPVITIMAPSTSPFVTESEYENVTATINGVTNSNQIVFKVDGMPKSNFTFDPATHQLSSNVKLMMGQNKIEIIAQNDCGTVNTFTYFERRVCNAPVLSVTKPQNNAVVNSPTLSITGSVTMISSEADMSITLNGQPVNFTLRGNAFSSNQQLAPGDNLIVITASNECGSDSETISIIYNECNQPTLSITSPATHLIQTSASSQAIAGATTNLTNATQLSVTHNGNGIANGFNTATGTFSLNVPLQNGANTVVINANNTCGNVSETIEIIKDCNKPIVTFLAPASSGILITNASYQIQANATGATQATLTVNGQNVPANFNASTGMLSATITLLTGTNAISVTGTNECGSTTESTGVKYQCPSPVINLTMPSTTQYTASSETLQLAGNAVNSTSVIVKLNGQIVNGSFNATTGVFTRTLSLNSGANNIAITADGSCGSDSKQITVQYEPQTNINTNCIPTITASFAAYNKVVNVASNLPLVKITLTFHDNTTQTFNSPGGNSGIFNGTGANINKCITDVSVESGCNTGESFHNNAWTGTCGTGKVESGLMGGDNDGDNVDPGNNDGNDGNSGNDNSGNNGGNGNGGNPNGNNGHGNNEDGVDSSNPGQGNGGPNGSTDPSGNIDDEGSNGNQDSSTGNSDNTNDGNNGNSGNNGGNGNGGNPNGNNGHGNNEDGVDSSNPGQGNGGPNGSTDPSGNIDDEGSNGNQGSSNGNSGNTSGGNNGNSGNNGNNGQHSMDPNLTIPNSNKAEEERRRLEEEARTKAAEEAARKQAAEEAARKQAAEEAARKQAAEEAARKQAAEEAARKQAAEEAARKRAAEEAARKRAAEEAARKQAAEEAARKRAAEEAARKQAAEEATRKQAVQDAARKKAAEEAAKKKAEEEKKKEEQTKVKPNSKPVAKPGSGGGGR